MKERDLSNYARALYFELPTQCRLWRAPWVIRVTQAGADMGEIGVRPACLVEGEVRHALALVELVEDLAASNLGSLAPDRARDPEVPLAPAPGRDPPSRGGEDP
jgi:hypothetical protein